MDKRKHKKAYFDLIRLTCPVCKKHVFKEINSFEICPICGWENDELQRKDILLKGGANKICLKEAIEKYRDAK